MNDHTRPPQDGTGLLAIDAQNDFRKFRTPAKLEGTVEAVPRMRRLVEAFRSKGAPIVHVVGLHLPDGSNVDR